MKNNLNLQDIFLNRVRREKIPVNIMLVGGLNLQGMIKGFDNFVIILEDDNNQNLIYKHSISFVVPQGAKLKVLND